VKFARFSASAASLSRCQDGSAVEMRFGISGEWRTIPRGTHRDRRAVLGGITTVVLDATVQRLTLLRLRLPPNLHQGADSQTASDRNRVDNGSPQREIRMDPHPWAHPIVFGLLRAGRLVAAITILAACSTAGCFAQKQTDHVGQHRTATFAAARDMPADGSSSERAGTPLVAIWFHGLELTFQ
jgi:hypothetical protein